MQSAGNVETEPQIARPAIEFATGIHPVRHSRKIRARAKEHLRGLHARRDGPWIDARAPGNAFQRRELRKSVYDEYDGLLPFALQADADNEPNEEQGATLGNMVAHLTDFAIHFDRALRGLAKL